MFAAALAAALLAAAPTAAAKDRPVSDHTKSVSVVALAVLEPRLEVDYDHALSDTSSVTAGATAGRSNNLLLRVFNALSGTKFTLNQMGAFGSYNYHFKHFNRGWYVSGIARYDRITADFGGDAAGSYNTATVGPAIGWKVATEGGFTFKWDFGLGYATTFGYTPGGSSASVGEPTGGVAGLGSLNLGYSF
jgi:hypothetical protein